ncbi:unnamed protein product [Sphagnum balticum]
MEITDSSGNVKERIIDDRKEDTRWEDICQKLRIDQNLDELKRSLLWTLLESQEEEDDSFEEGAEAGVEEEARNSWSSKTKRVHKERKTRYYDRKQQLELVLAAQELLGDDGHKTGDARLADDKACAEDTSKTNIWEDEVCLRLLREGIIPDTVDPQKMWSVYVGWDSRKMTTRLMEWSSAALMSGGGKASDEESEEREACAKSQGLKKRRRESDQLGRLVRLEYRQELRKFWLVALLLLRSVTRNVLLLYLEKLSRN